MESAEPVVDIGLAVDQRRLGMQALELRVGELRRAVADAQLVEPRALAHQHREGARADLGIERAAIARLDAVEGRRAVGDQPGEDVDAAGRAFRDWRCRRRAPRTRRAPAAARYRRSPSPAPRRRVRSISCMKTVCSFSSTVAFGPGRKLARTRQATAPSRRSMLAGWICASSISSTATISRRARIRRLQHMARQDAGRMAAERVARSPRPRRTGYRRPEPCAGYRAGLRSRHAAEITKLCKALGRPGSKP